MSIELLFLSQIRQDGGTQPRGALNEETVLEYAAQMENPSIEFPPVKVVYDGESYWLYDGFHRIAAAAEAGIGQFRAEVLQGTCQDAQWLSFSANQTHGLRRTNADKRRAVEAALRHERGMTMSDNAIAEHCGVSHPFVGSVRRELTCNGYKSEGTVEAGAAGPNLRVGKDGRAINVAKIGTGAKLQYFDKEAEGTQVAHVRNWKIRGADASVEIYVRELGGAGFIGAYEFHTSIPFGVFEPLSTEYVFSTREDAVKAAIDRACDYIDPQAQKAQIHGYWLETKGRLMLYNVRMALAEWGGEGLPQFWNGFVEAAGAAGPMEAKAADEWPESSCGFYPIDGAELAIHVEGPNDEWVKIQCLQVGSASWVARFCFYTTRWDEEEELSVDPVHGTREDAIADAALRGGLYLDSLAEQGKLPKGKGDMAELRWVRWQFAEHAGQATLDLDIWDEPKETPAPTVAQKLKKDPRLAEMEEAVRCITFLAGVTDWRALGGLAGYAHDGALLLGQVGCAKRNLTHFVKGLEAR